MRAETGRLFAHYPGGVPVEVGYRPFLIARLLEEGESADLRWLISSVSAQALREWLARRGSRQLSRRSHSFWALILDLEIDPATGSGAGGALWRR